ncbi:LGFP repeat-containing protein [Gordonia phthalatica]|uniref:LGFP repeat-containing protein n=1 Tax=Gordonia phthalatica TaxID=1136941 RepID=A0A0N9NBX1_9ACTN|nr:hypothetical protein [Gordonia phthalatica]ALG84512.1 hypothetical protein ACH46_08380 [Gordonia phthalatica]
MRNLARRRTARIVAGLGAIALIATGCGGDDVSTTAAESTTSAAATTAAPGTIEVTMNGVADREVTMTGPIAVRYSTATAEEKKILGLPLTGSRNAGTRDSGVVYQQFQGGVITARNAKADTPAYLTWGKIREAWNVERDADGKPVVVGSNGSAGPLGPVNSDVTTTGTVQKATFEHGEVTHDTATGEVTVTVNGKQVPAGL